MGSINLLIERIRADYPEFRFETSPDYLWSASRQTIYFNPDITNAAEYCLHELSHALLGHQGYEFDIDLIKLERDAWEYARTNLVAKYEIEIEDEIIQDNLETYREWLHARSTCPECKTSGLQSRNQLYRCIACGHTWRVNEARLCALRRYPVIQK